MTCCTPYRYDSENNHPTAPAIQIKASTNHFDAIEIKGGSSFLGTDNPQIKVDGEGPLKRKKLKPFKIGANPVTNQEFAKFVDETAYVSEAEKFGWSFVFWDDVPDQFKPTQSVPGLEWWHRVDGSYWRKINGERDALDLPDHPVVQVSWNDAVAYAKWAGGRLPKEAEWEHAARGGLGDVAFPWGDQEPDEIGYYPCNIWQGNFPKTNSCLDGFAHTAPSYSYQPNGYGLHNMVGNVWEWTADPYKIPSLKKQSRQAMSAMKGFKLSKGGSFLCHKSYCYRYRIAARTGNSPDSATPHQGFRVVWD